MELTEKYSTPIGIVRWIKMGSGPPLVFNHGTPFSSFVWKDVAESFSSRYTVYLWDMLGYGQSDMCDGQQVSLEVQGKLFTELLQLWMRDCDDPSTLPTVIAHDFGGAVALRAHLLHGAKYRALALVDPVAGPPLGSPLFHLIHDNHHIFTQLPPNIHRALVHEYISSASHQTLHSATMDALAAPWLTTEGQPAFYRQIAQHELRFTEEFHPKFPELAALPVLLCWGTEDTWIPLDRGRTLASRIPNVQFEEIAGAGHLVPLDKPAQLTTCLLTFLASLEK
ncbi:hypothetical protein QQS21_000946 [Conoideocrella luteorostrata]|uniref:AB hydrolase-1 domain-containing protein n=1 Tax=Conoideocrella luteorostrata TaxID=1105319 RepID=A0AAJ0FY12_9HYPO|nr:hypothetical protein QQS21_000946 [Conoideocrella luteorostrata]